MKTMTMKALFILLLSLAMLRSGFAADVPDSVILFKNVKVWDGTSENLKDVDVLVTDNLIRKIGQNLPDGGTYELDVKTNQYTEVNDPYPLGKIGVIEEGAYADILLVDGNPLEDITVLGGNEQWFDAADRDGVETMRLIMKDGKIYKNTL